VSHQAYNTQPEDYFQRVPMDSDSDTEAYLAIVEFDDHCALWEPGHHKQR